MSSSETYFSFARHSRRVAVLSYEPATLHAAITLAACGAMVELFSVPNDIAGQYGEKLHLYTDSLLQSLAGQNTMFNEAAYLNTYGDVASAVKSGELLSGYEHYVLFGQHEGRHPGSAYYGGLAEYDTFVCAAADWPACENVLAGRVLAHQRIIVCGESAILDKVGVEWMLRTPGMGILYSPPEKWLGPTKPALNRWGLGNWPRTTKNDLYPALRPDGAAWPRISIITPSFNQAEFLTATLESVRMQGYPNLEHIVIDGGSTDGSIAIIKQFEKGLSYWESTPDKGQSQALNKGFARATGSILTWLNSDDQLAPGALFVVAENFLRHAPGIVTGRCARIMHPATEPYHFHRCSIPLGEATPLPLARLLDLDGSWMRGDFFHQPEVFFSRDLWEAAGGALNEDLFYSMDYDLWVRMAKAGATILSIPEITAIFRQHAAQKTGGNDLPFLPELRRVNCEHRSGC